MRVKYTMQRMIQLFLLASVLFGCDMQSNRLSEIEQKREKLITYLNQLTQSKSATTEQGKQGIFLIHQYYTGQKTELSEAHKLLEQATQANDDEAMVWLAQLYYKGLGGIKQDKEKARMLFERAEELGNASALYHLAVTEYQQLSTQGGNLDEITSTLNRVKKRLNEARIRGFKMALPTLGEIESTQGKFGMAKYYFNKGVQQGDIQSMSSLGRMYVYGDGIKKDTKKGLKLLEKAWEHGYHDAAISLHAIYVTGKGVKKDEPRAVEYLRQAAELGSGDAYAYLCGSTQNAEYGIKKDINKAIELCKKGIQFNSIIAPLTLSNLYFSLEEDKLGRKWLDYSAKQNNPLSLSRLALFKLLGKRGYKKNITDAYFLSKKGAQLGAPQAMLTFSILSAGYGDYNVNFLDKPNYQDCWYWSSIVEQLSSGQISKEMITYCGEYLDDSTKNVLYEKAILRSKQLSNNFWVRGFLYMVEYDNASFNKF